MVYRGETLHKYQANAASHFLVPGTALWEHPSAFPSSRDNGRKRRKNGTAGWRQTPKQLVFLVPMGSSCANLGKIKERKAETCQKLLKQKPHKKLALSLHTGTQVRRVGILGQSRETNLERMGIRERYLHHTYARAPLLSKCASNTTRKLCFHPSDKNCKISS